jgi:hypothetical protein
MPIVSMIERDETINADGVRWIHIVRARGVLWAWRWGGSAVCARGWGNECVMSWGVAGIGVHGWSIGAGMR